MSEANGLSRQLEPERRSGCRDGALQASPLPPGHAAVPVARPVKGGWGTRARVPPVRYFTLIVTVTVLAADALYFDVAAAFTLTFTL